MSTRDPKQYPSLRNLQFSPFKEKDEQYVVLWDPSGLSQERLIVPLNYFYLLQYFDGEHSLEQVGAQYLQKFGEFLLPDRVERLVDELDAKLFLEGQRVQEAEQEASRAYRALPSRPAAYAGTLYESDPEKLTKQVASFFASKEGPPIKASENKGKPIRGLIVPHYDLREAGPIYAWGYKELADAQRPDLYVLLGTSHAGLETLFALTDKDFETPLGRVSTDQDLISRLRARGGERFFEEDRAHLREHSLECQLPFLQYVVGRDHRFTILPVLCGLSPFMLVDPQAGAQRDRLNEFLGLISSVLQESGRNVCFVASAELAHIGMRYGDSQAPTDFSFHRCMQTDMAMLKHVEDLQPDAFADFIVKEDDHRRISGFGVIYTLLRLIKAEKGQVLRYDRGVTDQYNSTVTYASLSFF